MCEYLYALGGVINDFEDYSDLGSSKLICVNVPIEESGEQICTYDEEGTNPVYVYPKYNMKTIPICIKK